MGLNCPMALVNAAGASVDTSERAAQELLQLMRQRHSARMAFDPLRKIPPDHLRLVLEAARWAPTAHNMQNYEVIVVDDVDRLGEIAAIRSEVSLVFIRENFEQLSFSEDELSRKKTGILARAFRRRGSHLIPTRSRWRISSTPSSAMPFRARQCF